MEYRLLDNQTGVLITRKPEMIYDELVIGFSGCPMGATAIIESGGKSFYREIVEETCAISEGCLCGHDVRVCVAILDHSARPKRWMCEHFIAEKQRDGGTLVYADESMLPKKYTDLALEAQALRKRCTAVEDRVQKLEDRLERLMEGYDII